MDQDEPVDIGLNERAAYAEGHVPEKYIRDTFNDFSVQY